MKSPPPSYSPLTSFFLAVYRLARGTGAFDIAIFKQAFQEGYFLYKRYIEDPFYNFSRLYPELFCDGIVLDIGANCGYTALVFSQATPMKVYAFEPEPDNLEAIKSVIARKARRDNIVIVPSAVGAEDGSLELWQNQGHHADHRIATNSFKAENMTGELPTITVPVVSVDSFLAKSGIMEPVSFIKIDVQGFEPPVCKGLIKTLERNPQISIALEYSPAQVEELGFSSSDLLDFFRLRRFTLYLMERNGSLKTFSDEELAKIISTRAYADILATRRQLKVA